MELTPRRRVCALSVLAFALALVGCASLGIGIDEKPVTPVERFIGALVDFRNADEVAAKVLSNLADHLEANPDSPVKPQIVKAADVIGDASARGRAIITSVALSQIGDAELNSKTAAIRAVIDELERQILAAQAIGG